MKLKKKSDYANVTDVIDSFTGDGVVLQAAEGGRVETKYQDLVKFSSLP